MVDSRKDTDKVQVGLTAPAAKLVDDLMGMGVFGERQDVYRLAIATALAKPDEIDVPEDVVGAGTAYSYSGGIDRDGRVTSLIETFAPEHGTDPARYAERLAHAGLAFLHTALIENQQLFQDIFPPARIA